MSIKNNDINHKVVSTLQSIDNMERAEPAPYLLTRVNAALAKAPARETVWSQIGYWISKPAVAVSIVAMFLLLNMLGIFIKKSNVNDMADTQSAYEYIANISSNYQIVNIPQ